MEQISVFTCKDKKTGNYTKTRSTILDRLVTQQFPTIPLEEVVEVLRSKEQKKRLSPFDDLDLVQCRAILVEWLVQVGEAIPLSNLTIHASVATLDRLLSIKRFPKSQLQLVASCCLLIQAKMDELEDHVPSIDELNYCTDNTYTPELFIQMETIILVQLGWDLITVTPAHFLDTFLNFCITDADTINGQPIQNRSLVKSDITKSASFFVDICRLEHNFHRYLPSVVAASALLLSRRILRISPLWSFPLGSLSSYEASDLTTCVDHIWRVYRDSFLSNTSGT